MYKSRFISVRLPFNFTVGRNIFTTQLSSLSLSFAAAAAITVDPLEGGHLSLRPRVQTIRRYDRIMVRSFRAEAEVGKKDLERS